MILYEAGKAATRRPGDSDAKAAIKPGACESDTPGPKFSIVEGQSILQLLCNDESFLSLLGASVSLKSSQSDRAIFEVDGTCVGLSYHDECAPPSPLDHYWRFCDIVITTSYLNYHVYMRNPQSGQFEYAWAEGARDFEESLLYHKGVVRLAKTAEWAILSRTTAIDLPPGNTLSAEHANLRASESEAVSLLAALAGNEAGLKSIGEIHRMLFPDLPEQEPARHELGAGVRMHMLHPALSPALDYTGLSLQSSRGDYISAYRGIDGHEWYREYMVEMHAVSDYAAELRLLQYSLLYLMGIRRTKLFRAKYSSRIYTVCLPSGLLDRGGQPSLAIVPLVSLSRLPNSPRFRSTITLSIILVPLQITAESELSPRTPGASEVGELVSDLAKSGGVRAARDKYELHGPLAQYLGDSARVGDLPRIVESLAKKIAGQTCGGSARRCESAKVAALRGLRESSIGSVCYLVDWPGGREAPWAQWCAGREDPVFERILHRAVFFQDHLNPEDAFSTRETVDFRSLSIGNAHGADMSGLTFYNPQEDLKAVLYPIGSERYPNHSILRWFAWQIYLDSACVAVRALLGRFHENIETTTDLRRVLRAVQDLSRELSEVYDLELADFFYRREYERLRDITHLDSDYEYMRTRLSSAQGESSLREQILMNNLVLAMTLASVFATLVVAVGQVQKWSGATYLYGAVGTVLGSLIISFGLLEPLRRISSRLKASALGRRQ